MSADSGTLPGTDEASSAPPAATRRKPRFAFFIATAGGLGYIPVAPGTWGSAAGAAIWILGPICLAPAFTVVMPATWQSGGAWFTGIGLFITAVIAALGVWASDRAARFSRIKDPQFVVIDEVSGQHLTLLLGLVGPSFRAAAQPAAQWFGGSSSHFVVAHVNLKYLLLGFILFRAFDIWKPFPARQAESLPGGWGIMADDWVAGIYAAIGLWIARAAGL
ncbi:MAG: phosphatidylglycerophosphatase A family protein [Candidatus Acidiferrales bacterium]